MNPLSVTFSNSGGDLQTKMAEERQQAASDFLKQVARVTTMEMIMHGLLASHPSEVRPCCLRALNQDENKKTH